METELIDSIEPAEDPHPVIMRMQQDRRERCMQKMCRFLAKSILQQPVTKLDS